MSSKIISNDQVKDLIHSIADYKLDSGDLAQESVLTGQRSFVRKAEHRKYVVTVYLFKCPNPIAELQELEQYENTIVKFRPNDMVLNNAMGDEPDFYVELIEPYLLDTTDRYGACNIVLKSIDGIVESVVTVGTGYGYGYGTNYGHGL